MVLIDMEMPKNCAECEVKEAAKCGTDYKYLFKHEKYYDSIRPDCPLKEHFPLKQITIKTNIYDQEEIHHNCTVQVLTNSVTGDTSIGWWEEKEEEE